MLKTQMISGLIEAGCDEAGRGPLAGSVFAAAVILNPERTKDVPEFTWLNDSKQLTEKQREALRPIIEHEAVSWAVVEVMRRICPSPQRASSQRPIATNICSGCMNNSRSTDGTPTKVIRQPNTMLQ